MLDKKSLTMKNYLLDKKKVIQWKITKMISNFTEVSNFTNLTPPILLSFTPAHEWKYPEIQIVLFLLLLGTLENVGFFLSIKSIDNWKLNTDIQNNILF